LYSTDVSNDVLSTEITSLNIHCLLAHHPLPSGASSTAFWQIIHRLLPHHPLPSGTSSTAFWQIIHCLLANHPLPVNFQQQIYELNLLVWDDGSSHLLITLSRL
jgi:hypothetical protein